MRNALRPPRTGQHHQRGAALLVFMLVFFMASMSWMLSQANSSRLRNEANKTTSAALAQAKEALIGRAAADDNRPGSLPCPDIDDDGKADGNFGYCSAAIGRLPWRTLDLPDLRDSEGNRLWYTLADELRDNSATAAINPTSPLSLALDGTANIAAIVFSAGPPLAGQNGRPSNDIGDYLDGANKAGGPYVSGPVSATFNDKTISISRDQLFSIVNRRILGLLGAALEKYYAANADFYPENGANLTTALDSHLDAATKDMLQKNNWYAVTTYLPAVDRQSATLTIAAPPATSCTVTPAQALACTHP